MKYFWINQTAGDQSKGGDAPKAFTQEDLNHILAEFKRELRADNEKLKGQLKEALDWKGEMEELLQQASEELDDDGGGKGSSGGDEGDADDDEDGGGIITGDENVKKAVEFTQKKLNRRIEKLEQSLKSEQDKAKSSELRRLESERDRLLADALTQADTVSVDGGLKIFREKAEYDPEEGRWFYKTDDGLKLTLEEGIKENIPSWLRKASSSGGSGAGDMKGQALQGHISKLKEDLASLSKKAAETNDSSAIRQYQIKKGELKDAEQKLTQQGGVK